VGAEKRETSIASGMDASKFRQKNDEKQYVNSLIFLAAAKYFKLESEN
jgi:hypothetical protein